MNFKLKKISFKDALSAIKRLLSWEFFPFITAAVLLATYYLSLDLVGVYFVCLTVTAMLLSLDDITPVLPQFLFMNVLVSEAHSPLKFGGNTAGSDYYTRTENLVQIVVLICLLAVAAIVRYALSSRQKKFKPSLVLISSLFLAASFVLNGVGADGYKINNLLYGAVLAFIVLGIYAVTEQGTSSCEHNYLKIAYGFVAFSALLTVELAVKYATNFDKIFYDGYIHKNAVILGWGVWNNIGTFFAISIPPVCILAAKHKFGYLFYVYAALLTACAFLTGSRQAMLGSSIAFLSCSVALTVKSRKRLVNSIIFAVLSVGVIITVAVMWDKVAEILQRLLKDIFDKEGEYLGNGRRKLILLGISYFKENPLFGSGFFAGFESFELVGITNELLPTFAHNTIAEILGTCGFTGIAAYFFHRVATFVEFFKKPTQNKLFIAISVLTLLIICLFDNYIFYLLPTLVYASMLPFACGTNQR